MKKFLVILLGLSFGLQIIDVNAASGGKKRPASAWEEEEDTSGRRPHQARRTTGAGAGATAGGAAAGAAVGVQRLPQLENSVGISNPRRNFVRDVLDMSEEDFAATMLSVDEGDRREIFNQLCATNDCNAGNFRQQSLAELRRDYIDHKETNTPSNRGSFHVIGAINPLHPHNNLAYQQVDIGAIQAEWGKRCEEIGKRLTVMVASNSNCLETTSELDIPDQITRYINDRTQGPAASISAAPGTLLRHYFGCDGKTQGAEEQVNLLEDVLRGLDGVSVPNGYLKLPTAAPQLAAVARRIASHRDLIKVGVHTNISVSHGLSSGDNHRYLPRGHRPIINQVFCAALDLAQGTNAPTPESTRIANILIETQVEAALLAAAINNTDIFVMPLLGCGAFGNNVECIIHALHKHQNLIVESGMRVVLNLFDARAVTDGLKDCLQTITHATGGQYIEYSQDGTRLLANALGGHSHPAAAAAAPTAVVTTPTALRPTASRVFAAAASAAAAVPTHSFPSSRAFAAAASAATSDRPATRVVVISAGHGETNIEKQDFGPHADTAAIVNAANIDLLYQAGARIDQAIRIAVTGNNHSEYESAIPSPSGFGRRLTVRDGWYHTQALIGSAGLMQRQYRYVIHTVGPNPGAANREALKQAICFALDQAKVELPERPGKRLTHIAIPMMCASAFGAGDAGMDVAKLLINEAVTTWLERNAGNHELQEIRLVVFSGNMCAICMDDPTIHSPLINLTPCNHIFHAGCVAAQAICPICRTPILG